MLYFSIGFTRGSAGCELETGALAQQSDLGSHCCSSSPWEEPLRSLFAVLFFLVFANPLLFADQIAFKNGDRPYSAILKSDAKILVILTAVAGEVTAAWQEIQ